MWCRTQRSFLVGQSGCNGNSWARIDHTCITAMLLCTQHTVAIFFFPGRVVFGYYIESMEKKEKKKQASKQLLLVRFLYIRESYILCGFVFFPFGFFSHSIISTSSTSSWLIITNGRNVQEREKGRRRNRLSSFRSWGYRYHTCWCDERQVHGLGVVICR